MKLIDKAALVAEIENLLDKGRYHDAYQCAYRDGNNGALYALKGKLDTLEVKGIDLEKEVRKFIKDNCTSAEGPDEFLTTVMQLDDMVLFARHFVEIGLKTAQKGEEI